MTFSLIILLYFYFFFLFVWFLFSVVAVYHMVKYGFLNLTTVISTVLFVGVSVLIFYASFYYLDQVNWGTSITFFNSFDEMLF